jgi:hypothetical protein
LSSSAVAAEVGVVEAAAVEAEGAEAAGVVEAL